MKKNKLFILLLCATQNILPSQECQEKPPSTTSTALIVHPNYRPQSTAKKSNDYSEPTKPLIDPNDPKLDQVYIPPRFIAHPKSPLFDTITHQRYLQFLNDSGPIVMPLEHFYTCKYKLEQQWAHYNSQRMQPPKDIMVICQIFKTFYLSAHIAAQEQICEYEKKHFNLPPGLFNKILQKNQLILEIFSNRTDLCDTSEDFFNLDTPLNVTEKAYLQKKFAEILNQP